MPNVILRATTVADLPLLTGGESPFDDFGPRAAPAEPFPAEIDVGEPGGLAVVGDDELAGYVSWHWSGWGPTSASKCPDIGIWLRASHRGRGIGTIAQRQLAELIFRHTAGPRVQATTDCENLAEQRALERAGFRREGVVRAAQWRDGRHHDMVLYAVLRGELN